jgi:tetratricopeptide (TPR) repeat protein
MCTEADDKASLAMGMTGLTAEHVVRNRLLEASRLASEYMAIVESLGEPMLTVGLSFAAIIAKHQTGETDDILRWAQAVIDFANSDPEQGKFIIGAPLATALAWRGVGRFQKGLPGWSDDFARASVLAETADALSRSAIVTYKYAGIPRGVFLADDAVLREVESAAQLAERSNDDMAVVLSSMVLGMTLIYHGEDRQRGYAMLRALRETCIQRQFGLSIVPFTDAYLGRELMEQGDEDAAIEHWRTLIDAMLADGNYANVDIPMMFLAQTLVSRGEYDEAAAEIERLAETAAARDWRSRDISVLRLRVLLARACGDDAGYQKLRDQYRAMANELGFEGHMKWAAEMS